MGYDLWAIETTNLGSDREFVLVFRDSSLVPGEKGWQETSAPMSEQQLREASTKLNIAAAKAEEGIARARKKVEGPPVNPLPQRGSLEPEWARAYSANEATAKTQLAAKIAGQRAFKARLELAGLGRLVPKAYPWSQQHSTWHGLKRSAMSYG